MIMICLSFATAATFTRIVPTTVAPGSTFSLIYSTQDATGNWGVLLEEDITGGCECKACSNPTHISTGFLSPSTTQSITITAPSSGECTFTGNYLFADTTAHQEVNFPIATVKVDARTCVPTTWLPSPSTVCDMESFTQSSDCGDTQTAIGTKYCPEPSKCEFYQTENDEGVCETALWVYIIGLLLFIIYIVYKMIF